MKFEPSLNKGGLEGFYVALILHAWYNCNLRDNRRQSLRICITRQSLVTSNTSNSDIHKTRFVKQNRVFGEFIAFQTYLV
jgi:hypothetical protein